MGRGLFHGVAAAVVVVVVAWAPDGAVAPAANAAPGDLRTGVRGAVVGIAADGTRVAIHSTLRTGKKTCDGIAVWDVASRGVTRFTGVGGCDADELDTPVSELALAGARTVWTDDDYEEEDGPNGPIGLNTCTIRMATLAHRAARTVRNCDTGESAFLRADRSLVAVRTFFEDDALADSPNPGIFRLVGTTLVKVFDDSYSLLDAEGGRLLVTTGRNVVLATPTGTTIRELRKRAYVDHGLLEGNRVVLFVDKRLEVYSAPALRGVRVWSTPKNAEMIDLARGVMAYAVGGKIRLKRLADGRDRVLRTVGNGLVDVELEPAGLFYAYNVRDGGAKPGRVVFVPFAALAARLR